AGRSRRRGQPQGRSAHARSAGARPHRARDRAGNRRMPSIRDLERRVGEEVGVSPWLEVTQERIDTFAKAINDFQWIHVDPARAKKSPFGGPIAHGFLT